MASTKIMNSGCLIVFIIAMFYCAQSNGNHQQDIDRGKFSYYCGLLTVQTLE